MGISLKIQVRRKRKIQGYNSVFITTMDVFTTAFYIAILLNGFTTLRSSRYWEKFKHYFLGGSSDPVVAQDGEDATLDKSDTDASNPEGNKNDLKAEHIVLLKKYLSVYLLATLSDWFQGPYVYALYSSYGFSKRDNATLFVAGFGSSLIFGSFIGGLADSFGRRKFTVVYCLVYALSCVTKHFKNYWMLMFGRILGGIATSLLFTVFDSRLIRAHSDRGLMSFLPSSFSVAAYGNSIVAILSGLISEKAASAKELKPLFSQSEDTALLYKYGYLPPFDMSMFTQICYVVLFLLYLKDPCISLFSYGLLLYKNFRVKVSHLASFFLHSWSAVWQDHQQVLFF